MATQDLEMRLLGADGEPHGGSRSNQPGLISGYEGDVPWEDADEMMPQDAGRRRDSATSSRSITSADGFLRRPVPLWATVLLLIITCLASVLITTYTAGKCPKPVTSPTHPANGASAGTTAPTLVPGGITTSTTSPTSAMPTTAAPTSAAPTLLPPPESAAPTCPAPTSAAPTTGAPTDAGTGRPQYATEYFKPPWGTGGGGPDCPVAVPARTASALFGDNASQRIAAISEHPAIARILRNVTTLANLYQAQYEAASIGGVPPLSVVISLGKTTIFEEHRGYRNATDPASGRPNLNTVYEIGSNTKTFTTLGFYREMQRRSLGLLDTVSDYLPGFLINNPYSRGNVTLASLASQSSGLPRAATCGNVGSCSPDQIIDSYQYQDLKFAPHTEGDYSNLGLSLLGHVVAAAAGRADGTNRSYEEYVARHILGPLNMTRSGFYPWNVSETQRGGTGSWPAGTSTADIVENFAVPIIPSATHLTRVPPSLWTFGWNNPGGGMLSTPTDMLRYMQWALSSSTLSFDDHGAGIGASTVQSWMSPGFSLRDGLSAFGSGAWERAYVQGTWVVTKAGLATGTASNIAMVPELGLSVATFNAVFSSEVADEFAALVLEELIPTLRGLLMAEQCTPLPSDVSSLLVGTWAAGTTSFNFSRVPSDPCRLYGAFSGIQYSNNRSLLVEAAPTSADVNPGAIFGLTNSSFNSSFVGWLRDTTVLGAFRYSANLEDPSTQPFTASCYMEASIGVNAVGYVVRFPVTGEVRLWFPNMFGLLLFQKL